MIRLIDEIMNCFKIAIDEIENQNSSSMTISPPVSREDDEAEMLPLFESDYLDEIPF